MTTIPIQMKMAMTNLAVFKACGVSYLAGKRVPLRPTTIFDVSSVLWHRRLFYFRFFSSARMDYSDFVITQETMKILDWCPS